MTFSKNIRAIFPLINLKNIFYGNKFGIVEVFSIFLYPKLH